MQWLWLAAAVALASCKEPPPSCITVDTACAPQYTPTFANVYTNTIVQDCGSNRGSCHSSSGASGLDLSTEQGAFDNLTRGYVTPGNPGCSDFVVRTNSPGKDYQMPQGTPLVPAERCALVQWVQAGAPR